MVFKLIRTDSEEPCKILLGVGKHLIGRGKFLDCDDKRVSRHHGELEVTEDAVIIKALHQNPCFVIKKGTQETHILKQSCASDIRNGDRFGLLPDSYWYELLHCAIADEDQQIPSNIIQGNEDIDSAETEPFETDNDGVSQEININLNETITNNNPGSPSLLSPEPNKLATSSGETVGCDNDREIKTEETSPSKRSHSIEDKECTSGKKVKVENEENPEVKEEESVDMSEPSDASPGPSNDQMDPSRADNGQNDASKPPADPSQRERCIRNPQHKAQFSHPGDGDWGAGERGACPWGARCRRRDPRHWRAHDHPPAARQPPPHQPGNKRKRAAKKRFSETDDDEDDTDENSTPILNNKRTRKPLIKLNDWDNSDSLSGEDPYATDDEDSEWKPLD
ncbi:unnamed protein product [Diatraea saccharalis]|uniref:Aprataxin and PNK-like factor n=1 Tax=Diatraea saccharalis TaxID=40085 RepID=A0A9N9RAG6_9NEOP|nr:unnamed protein product [Diatraea saccharalis]